MSDKGETVIQKLRKGWTDVPALLEMTGWQAHTLRAAISTAARKFGFKVERKRENGVTSYRAVEQ